MSELAGDPDGRVRATLEIVWLSRLGAARKPAEAAAPGSATVSLQGCAGEQVG